MNEDEKQLIRDSLPHLYGWKWYEWAWRFFNSTNRINLLCAANQISKSSTQIRKCIDWCTNSKKWSKLWPRNPVPRNIWYLYPDSKVATVEFETKWIPEFMPRGPMRDHPVYGWKAVYEKRRIEKVVFNSGVTLHFKTYMQNPQSLQSTTVHAIFCDEELPENLYGELVFRLTAPMGHFHMVFTATLNQQTWWQAIEGRGTQETFKTAFKQQISMYDCCFYRDGTPGPFDTKRIQSIKDSCNSDLEIQRRVYGKFIAETGRKYHAFNPERHFVKPFEISPGQYHIFGGVDPGSGGSAHPAGMGLVAVDATYRKAFVIAGRRMDNQETASSDILSAYIAMRGSHSLRNQFYDQASADFNIVSSRAGESFCKSEKSHELGEDIINTLFKNDMLFIFDTEELRKLGQELMTVNLNTPKRKCKDDFIDGALRYPCTSIPWDWTAVRGIPLDEDPEERPFTQQEYDNWVEEQRRGPIDRARKRRRTGQGKEWDLWEEETSFWNEQYGG